MINGKSKQAVNMRGKIMIAYLIKKNGENTGRIFSTEAEAEKTAQYLNDIPDVDKYTVAPVDIS